MSLSARIEAVEALAQRRQAARAGVVTLYWAVYLYLPNANSAWVSETFRPYAVSGGPPPLVWWPDNCYGAEHVQAWQDRGYECVLMFNPDDYLFAGFEAMPVYGAEHALPWRGYQPGACLALTVAGAGAH